MARAFIGFAARGFADSGRRLGGTRVNVVSTSIIGALGIVSLTSLFACGSVEPSSTDTASGSDTQAGVGRPGVAVIQASVDVLAACGVEGATQVSLRATRIACEQDPPPPCTVEINPYETIFGDFRECAFASETAAKMYVELEESGRYLVDARIITASGYVSVCHGQSGSEVTVVSGDAVSDGATVVVDDLGSPCPES
ncbi:MAG: hypothetical protein ACPG4T_21310 [Nannocystaceae bacterium]